MVQHGRQVHLDRLEAGIHFARHARDVAVHLDLRRKSGLGPVPQRGEHLPGLVAVVVDRLLAEQDEPRVLAAGELEQHACHGRRLECRVRLDEDRAVGAHGERVAQLLLGFARPDADGDDLVRLAALAQSQRFLERDRVEGIGAHLDAVGDDARAVRPHAHAHVVVDDPLDADQDPAHAFHSVVCGAWYRIRA